MATKKLESITVKVIGCAEEHVTFNVTDTATDPMAHNALDAFKRGHAMEFTSEGREILIPFHAVEYVVINADSTAEVPDKGDPYGCDEESEGD